MRKRSTLLLALLHANDCLGQPAVHRTTLVKQVFLAETIRPIYLVWHQFFSFYRYNHGPYSHKIFERTDTLVFSGFIEVASFKRQGGKTEARYQITPDGTALLKQTSNTKILDLATDLVWALQSLGVEQAGTICKLVYQESEFANIFERHLAKGIGAEAKTKLPPITSRNNRTFATLTALLNLSQNQANQGSGSPIPPREIVRVYLQYLFSRIPDLRQ